MTESSPAAPSRHSPRIRQTDVVVIGAGPIGLFSVFQCGMLGLRCAVVDSLEAVGGQLAALYPEKPIYDVPGFPAIPAQRLVDELARQAAPFAPQYHLSAAAAGLARRPEGGFELTLSTGDILQCGGVLVAAGAGAFGPNRPPLHGIEAFEGSSVFYLVTRREAFRNRRVVIAGGGDSAVDWAISLADVASSVMLVHRRPKFRAAPESAARLQSLAASGAIELVVPYQLHGLEGRDGVLDAVIVADLDGETRRLDADVLLPFFGLSTDLGPLAQWGFVLDQHRIVIDPTTGATSVPGIFAAGDIALYPHKLKLILTGFAEAAQAAHALRALLRPDDPLHFEHSTTRGVPGSA